MSEKSNTLSILEDAIEQLGLVHKYLEMNIKRLENSKREMILIDSFLGDLQQTSDRISYGIDTIEEAIKEIKNVD